jgi:hypothetical protein
VISVNDHVFKATPLVKIEYLSPITERGKENSFDAFVMAVTLRLWAEKEANVI